MAEHLLKFVNLPKAMPDKREAESRRADFQEIYERFRPAEAKAQSSRCSGRQQKKGYRYSCLIPRLPIIRIM